MWGWSLQVDIAPVSLEVRLSSLQANRFDR
jgi:hypothetical protein